MSNCKPVSTPIENGAIYEKHSAVEELFDVHTYQKAVGCLTYLSISCRPDIAAAVGILSRFMSSPAIKHWVGIKRILRYLKGTCDYGLIFNGGDEDVLHGFTDSDWAGDVQTRKSTSGYVFKYGNSTISWASRRQSTVAKSTCEAEYVALSMATQEAVWLRRLFVDIGISVDSATCIHADNQGAIDLAKNPKHHHRTKHIDISFHFTREKIISKEIDIRYIPSTDNIADIMTKGTSKFLFEKFRRELGVDKCI